MKEKIIGRKPRKKSEEKNFKKNFWEEEAVGET
jgi:hypothetical protein